jgi:hypothetical protein
MNTNRLRRFALLWVLAEIAPPAAYTQAVVAPPTLILTNYNRIPIGQREALEGDAYVARTDDAVAAWLNPAGLAKSEKSSLNASATAYEWINTTAEGLGTTTGRSQINTVGTLFSFVVGGDVLHSERWRLGFAIVSPVVWQPSDIDLAIPLQGGKEQVAYTTSVNFSVLVPAASVAYAPGGVSHGTFRVGASVGFAISSLTQNIGLTDRITTVDTASSSLRGFSGAGSAWSLVLGGGVQWDATPHLSFGAHVAAPNIKLFGSTQLAYQNSFYGPGDYRDLVFRDSAGSFEYRLPLEATAGAAFRGKNAELELDVHYYGAVNSYNMYSSTVLGTLTTQVSGGPTTVTQRPFTPTANSTRSLVNLAVGGNYGLSRAFGLHAGFSTDQSPVDVDTLSIFRKLDLSHFTAGVSVTGVKGLSGSLGFAYSFGSNTRQTLGSTEGGQTTQTKLTVKTTMIMFALSYAFGGGGGQ